MEPEEQSLSQKALAALQEAVQGVIEDARRNNRTLVVWENGAVRYITPDQLPPAKQPSP